MIGRALMWWTPRTGAMLGFKWSKSAATTIASIEIHQSPMLLERLLTWRSLIYSVKCFAAAMLALFVAFSLGTLSRRVSHRHGASAG